MTPQTPFEHCIRCGRPIRTERQSCVVNGKPYPYAGCLPDNADTRLSLIEANGVYLNVARYRVQPIQILDDPYAD